MTAGGPHAAPSRGLASPRGAGAELPWAPQPVPSPGHGEGSAPAGRLPPSLATAALSGLGA